MNKIISILIISLVGICTSDPVPAPSSGLYCDTLLCPATANTCIVQQNSSEDLLKIVTTRTCKQGDKVVLTDKSEVDNPTRSCVNSYATSSFGGGAASTQEAEQISENIRNNIQNDIQNGFIRQQQMASNMFQPQHQLGFGAFNRPFGFGFARPAQGFYNTFSNNFSY